MRKKMLLPLLLILILVLAACSGADARGSEAALEPSSADMAATDDDMAMDSADHEDAVTDDEAMDSESMDDDMAMDADDHDETMMDDGDAMSDDAIDEGTAMEAADHDGAMMEEAAADGEAMEDGMAPASGETPAWQTLALTNAATGETFTLADFAGKTVFVEPMATWCSNCKQQQGQVIQAKTQFGDEVVFVGLSLETTLPSEDLAAYATSNGFDWTYAVMSDEILAALADQFGRAITSAPSTPHFLIRPDGTFTDLSTGINSAAELVALIQDAQS
ncbi:MAG: TlpA family protein disulfide reductase [Candidatus Promineifilaceae bacterium]